MTRTTAIAIAVNTASGASLALVALVVDALGPSAGIGWWALGSGLILAILAPPTLRSLRDALVPGALAALALGSAALALGSAGPARVGSMVVLALAIAPAVASFARLRMPPAPHLGGLSGGVLGVVVLVSLGEVDAGTVLAIGAGLALAAQALVTSRTVGLHRVIGFNAVVMLVAGLLLTGGSFTTGGFGLPSRRDVAVLVAAIVLAGVALPLARVRVGERLGPSAARHHLPWFTVGAAAAGWWDVPPTRVAVAGIAVLLVSAWVAGRGASEVTEAEVLRTGP